MKRSRDTEEQIAFALKQVDLGTPVPDVCRQERYSGATFYAWRKKFDGLGPSEEGNQRLERIVADLSLYKATL